MDSQKDASLTNRLSRNRKEDLTIDELRNMEYFTGLSDEVLSSIIEAAIIFSRIIVAIQLNETKSDSNAKNSKRIGLNNSFQKKAA